MKKLLQNLHNQRQNLINKVMNLTENKIENSFTRLPEALKKQKISNWLRLYELDLEIVTGRGIPMSLLNKPQNVQSHWTYIQSLFFAATALTTIGNIPFYMLCLNHIFLYH